MMFGGQSTQNKIENVNVRANDSLSRGNPNGFGGNNLVIKYGNEVSNSASLNGYEGDCSMSYESRYISNSFDAKISDELVDFVSRLYVVEDEEDEDYESACLKKKVKP